MRKRMRCRAILGSRTVYGCFHLEQEANRALTLWLHFSADCVTLHPPE
jgi:hypothetical protein